MKRNIRILIVLLLSLGLGFGTFSLGCGGSSACNDFISKLEDECGVMVGDGDAGCEDGSTEECTSQCGLAADCQVLNGSGDINDQDFLDALQDFINCTAEC